MADNYLKSNNMMSAREFLKESDELSRLSTSSFVKSRDRELEEQAFEERFNRRIKSYEEEYKEALRQEYETERKKEDDDSYSDEFERTAKLTGISSVLGAVGGGAVAGVPGIIAGLGLGTVSGLFYSQTEDGKKTDQYLKDAGNELMSLYHNIYSSKDAGKAYAINTQLREYEAGSKEYVKSVKLIKNLEKIGDVNSPQYILAKQNLVKFKTDYDNYNKYLNKTDIPDSEYDSGFGTIGKLPTSDELLERGETELDYIIKATIPEISNKNKKNVEYLKGETLKSALLAEEYSAMISPEYKETQQDMTEHPENYPGFKGRLHRAMYQIPGGVGSMAALLPAQIKPAAEQAAISKTLGYLWKGVSKVPGWQGKVGQGLVAAAGVAGAAFMYDEWLDAASNEGYSQAGNVFEEKVTKEVADKYNVDLQNLTLKEYADLKGIEQSEVDPNITKKEMFFNLATEGSVHPGVNKILTEGAKNLDDLVEKNIGVVAASNMATNLLLINPLANNLLKTGSTMSRNLVKGAVMSTKQGRRVLNAYKTAGSAIKTNKFLGTVAPLAKGGGKLVINTFKEGLEEGTQMKLDEDYKAGLNNKDQSFAKNILDGYGAMLHTGKVILGISHDPVLSDNKQFWAEVEAGQSLGAIMGGMFGGISTAKSIKNNRSYADVDKLMTNGFYSQYNQFSNFTKGEFYAQKALKGKQSEVLEWLNGQKNKLPNNISKEDLENEIKIAKDVMAVSQSKNTKNFLKELGYKSGSEEHEILTGLYARAKGMIDVAAEHMTSASTKISKKIQSKDVTDMLNGQSVDIEQHADYKQALAIEAQIEAIENAKKALKLNKEGDKYAKKERAIVEHSLNSKLTKLKKQLQEVSKKVDSNVLDILKNNEELYSGLLIDSYDLTMAETDINIISGMHSLRGHINGSVANLTGVEFDKDGKQQKKVSKENIEGVKNLIEQTKELKKSGKILDNEFTRDLNVEEEEVEEEIIEDGIEGENTEEVIEDTTENKLFDEEGNLLLEDEEETTPDTSTEEVAEPSEEQKKTAGIIPGETFDDFVEATTTPEQRQALEELKRRAEDTAEETTDEVVPTEEKATSEETVVEDEAKDPESDLQIDEKDVAEFIEAKDLLSNLLHYNPEDTNKNSFILSNYNGKPVANGSELAKALKSKTFKEDHYFQYITTLPTEDLLKFRKKGESGYDSLPLIVLIVNKKSGKQYAVKMLEPFSKAATNNPEVAKTDNGSYPVRSEEDILRLRNNRNYIFDLIIKARSVNAKVVPQEIVITNGKFKNQKGNRKLQEVKGLNLPENQFDINPQSVEMGYTLSGFGNYALKLFNERTIPNVGHSNGAIYIMVDGPSSKVPLQLNPVKFSDFSTAKGNPVVDLIFDLVVREKADRNKLYTTTAGVETNMTVRQILDFIVLFGESTMISKDELIDKPFLVEKIFNIKGNILYISGSEYNIDEVLQDKTLQDEIKEKIELGFHWNTEKEIIPKKLSSYDSLLNHFYRNSNSDKLVIIPEIFEITREQLGLTKIGNRTIPFDSKDKRAGGIYAMSWLITTGKLQTNIADEIFNPSFIYGNKPVIIKKSEEPVSKEDKIVKIKQKDVKQTDKTTIEDSENPSINNWLDNPEAYSLISTKKFKKADTLKEVMWLYDVLGLTNKDVKVLKDIYTVAAMGVRAMGAMRADSIMLWERMEEGTAYHEAYHRVSLLLLPKEERQAIYNEIRKNRKSLKYATDQKIEEFLADDFKMWMLSKTMTFKNASVEKVFRRIFDFIKSIFGINDTLANELYDKIASGSFRGIRYSEENLVDFYENYSGVALLKIEGVEYNNIANLKQYHEYVEGLAAFLLRTTKDDVSFDDANVSLNFENLKNQILSLSEDKSGRLNEVQKAAYKELYNNFDNVKEDILNKIRAIGANVRLNDEAFIVEAGTKESDETSYMREDGTLSIIDKAIPSIKFFMATLYERKSGVIQNNPVTGLWKFVDPNKAWQKTLFYLHDSVDFTHMMLKLKDLARHDDFFQSLLKGIETKDDDNFNTKFFSTVKKHKNDYTELHFSKIKGKGGVNIFGYTFKGSNSRSAIKRYSNIWSKMFAMNPNIFTQDHFNVNYLQDVYNEFADLKDELIVARTNSLNSNIFGSLLEQENIDNLKKSIVNLLNKINIAVDSDTLDSMIYNHLELKNHNDYITALIDFITNPDVKVSISDIFERRIKAIIEGNGVIKVKTRTLLADNIYTDNYNKPITFLAEHYNKVHPDIFEGSVLAADNSKRYEISENNYITDLFRLLKNDPNIITSLKNSLYASGTSKEGSYFLTQLEDPKVRKHLNLKTFINFIELYKSDNGRDYFEITDIEDYMTKLIAVDEDYMVIPTMADKKKFYFIEGVKFPKDLFNFEIKNDKEYFRYSDKYIRQFESYFYSELEAVEEAYRQYKEFVLGVNPDTGEMLSEELKMANKAKIVDNYHTTNEKKGGNARGEGNGLRFRYMDGYYTSTGFKSFNQTLDELGMDKGLAEIKANFFNSPNIYDYINNMLNKIVQTELNTAIDLGIITGKYDNYKTLKNKFLPDKRIKEISEKFGADGVWKENFAIRQMIATYALNSTMSVIEFEKVFSKDPAFYKNTEDKIKRLSGLLSTGENLRVDFNQNHDLYNKTEFNVVELEDNTTFHKNVIDSLEPKFKEYYKNIYKNTFKKIEEESDEDYEKRFDKFIQKNIDVKLKALKGINQTDATVFISPAMYKSILIRLGEFDKKTEKAYNRLMSGKSLTDTDFDLVLQPLKMVYFGNKIIEDLKLDIPIFDKMAMFPIFPSTATGDLKVLYDRMMDEYNPVDMVAFSSAVKVGGRKKHKFYKEDGTINNIYDSEVYKQNFKDLRRQLLTTPHEDAERAFGSQIKKVAMSNINPKDVFSNNILQIPGKENLTGAELIEEYINTISEISNKGKNELFKELGVKKDKNGDLVITDKNLSRMLVKDAKNSGFAPSVINMLKMENGKMKAPLSALADFKWIESRFISYIGAKCVDLETAGGSFIQMTGFGIKKTGYSEALLKGYEINNGKELNLNVEEGTMDVVISINLFKDIVPAGLNFEDSRKWLIDNNIIGENSKACAVGYRVPTQSLASIPVLKITDVLPSTIGDTIILPDEFIALSGSDFDIDKLYVARYYFDKQGNKIKFNDFVEEVESKIEDFTNHSQKENTNKWSANSKEANTNRLLDVMITYLTSESTFVDRNTSIDAATSVIKNEILPEVDNNEKVKDLSNIFLATPTFQLYKKLENAAGKNGIAPFALANTHHVLTKIANIEFVETALTKKYGFTTLNKEFGDDNIKIHDWLSAMINAHVDMAKDAYIARMNVNEITYNHLCLLLRTGKGKLSFYFLGQRILKDIAKASMKANGKVSDNISENIFVLKKQLEEGVLSKYIQKTKNLAKTDEQKDKLNALLEGNKLKTDLVNETNVVLNSNRPIYNTDGSITSNSIEYLKKQLEEEDSFNWYYNQLLVAKTYYDLNYTAIALNSLVQASQIDTKKYGNTFSAIKLFNNNKENIITLNKTFKNVQKIYDDTFLGTIAENVLEMPKTLFRGRLINLTKGFDDIFDEILLRVGLLYKNNDKLANIVTQSIIHAINSDFFNKRVSDNGVKLKELFIGDNTIAKRLYNIKNSILSGVYPELLEGDGNISNSLLNLLNPNDVALYGIDVKVNKWVSDDMQTIVEPLEFLSLVSLKESNGLFKQEMINSFNELINSTNPEIKEFAEDLIYYAFYTSGGTVNFNSFFEFVDESYKKDIGYYDHIERSIKDFETESVYKEQIIDDVFKNNINNKDLVPAIPDYAISGKESTYLPIFKNIEGEFIDVRRGYPLLFKLSEKYAVGVLKNGNNAYRPYVKYYYEDEFGASKTSLYKWVATDASGQAIYQISNKKGYNKFGRVIKEYGVDRSIIDENNILENDDFNPKAVAIIAKRFLESLKPISKTYVSVKNIIKEQGDLRRSLFESEDAMNNIVPVGDRTVLDSIGLKIFNNNKRLNKLIENVIKDIKTIDDFLAGMKSLENKNISLSELNSIEKSIMFNIVEAVRNNESEQYDKELIEFAENYMSASNEEVSVIENTYTSVEDIKQDVTTDTWDDLSEDTKNSIKTQMINAGYNYTDVELANEYNKMNKKQQDNIKGC